MTRPKVPPDQRQRTAMACNSCKRRKQKCNGLCPCNTCEKRKFTCVYSEREGQSPIEGRPVKKRATGNNEQNGGQALPGPIDRPSVNPSPKESTVSPMPPTSQPPLAQGSKPILTSAGPSTSQGSDPSPPGSRFVPTNARPTLETYTGGLQFSAEQPQIGPERPVLMSRDTTQSGAPDEEAIIYTQSRMLEDPTGRLLYVGDSATLSFLQLLRMIVENVAGTSPFTNDPNRHKIVEGQLSLPAGGRPTHLLPDKTTAHVLVESFFVNTHGFLQIFERPKFLEDLERCYSDPLCADPSWLCLLNLVFAIGLTMATPMSGSSEAVIVEKLRSEHLDRAEAFYRNAKSLNDPMIGFEDQDFWSVQALLLMSVYMLAKAKRNTAFALLGMAARSAYSLGLHREETMVIFNAEEQAARRNLWRSIFVVDRLLSCSLGRPTAISEDDCSGDTLRPVDPPPNAANQGYNSHGSSKPSFSETSALALEAAVRSCVVIGLILKKVYQQRKISTRLAQEIADMSKTWLRALPSILHWRQAANAEPSQGVAILHVNLFYCHSIILLTRPFFLYVLHAEIQRQSTSAGSKAPRPYSRMEKFSEACVIASTHTILLVQNAFEAGYLSRRNPAVIYFLFAAGLVILANEFAPLYNAPAADMCIHNAVAVMGYCAESDQQASRLVYILSSFRDVVAARRKQNSQSESMNLPSLSSHLAGLQTQQRPSVSDTPGPSGPPGHFHTTPRLHPVPIHIYPGLQQPPRPNDSPNYIPLPQPAISPAHSNPVSGAPQFDQGNTLPRLYSLSNVLDLSALDVAHAPSLYSEESAPEEHIDFDALWAWPSNATLLENMQSANQVDGRGHAGRDVVVPLYAVMRNEGERGEAGASNG